MKKCIKKICLALMLFIGISCLYCVNADSSNYNLNFTYEGVDYNINIEQLANENNINLEEYPYHLAVTNNSSSVRIYCSKKRMQIMRKSGTDYQVDLGNEAVSVIVNLDGSINTNFVKLTASSYYIAQNRFLASNHNIYHYYTKELILGKNSGYEYDEATEKVEEINDFLKTNSKTIVYEKASVCYDELATLDTGSIVKRVKTEVNEINGHKWDKVELSNGKSGYVFSDSIVAISEEEKIKEITFPYNEKIYRIYVSSNEEVNLEDYPYYFVTGDQSIVNSSNIAVYFSKQKVRVDGGDSVDHRVQFDGETLLMKIGSEGSMKATFEKLERTNFYIRKNCFLASNHSIYFNKELILGKNSGYEYDEATEKVEEINDLVKTSTKTIVYEKASVCYDELATLDIGSIVKRVKTEVNEINGHKWDKVELSNGKSGYVFSDSIVAISEEEKIKEITFPYNEKIYRIYVSSNEEVNLEDYPYYFVTGDQSIVNSSNIAVYFSKQKVRVDGGDSVDHRVQFDGETLLMKIGSEGSMKATFEKLERTNFYIRKNCFLASNHSIYFNKELILGKNSGYSDEQIKAVKAYCRYNKINNFNGEINSTYENDIIVTIKEFQKLNGLFKTGCLDNETFNAMGLNDEDKYNTYLKIANNYITYGNPYGPTPYNVPNSDYEMQFELERKKAQFYDQAKYDEQESKYNSMSEQQRIIRDGIMGKAEASLKVIAEVASKPYPHLSEGVKHFLSNKGGIHYVTDVEELFKVGKSGENRSNYLEHTKKAIEKMLTVDKATDFSMVKTLPVTLPKTINNLDWYGLYGTYHFSVEGSCYKKGDFYVATGYCYARDYYDFDKVDEIEYMLNFINDLQDPDKKIDKADFVTTIFADLHYAGRAKFYYIEGKDDGFTMTWYANNEGENNENEENI